MKSVKINAFLTSIKTLFTLLFPLITFPYASRVLYPEGIGKVNFALSIIYFFEALGMLGIEKYGIREGSRIRDDKIQFSQLVKELFTINFISFSISFCILLICINIIPKFSEYKLLLLVTSTCIIFDIISLNWLYSAVEDFLYTTIRSIMFQLLSLILLFVFVKTKDDYIKYAAISVVSSVGSNIFNFFHARKYVVLKTNIPLDLKKHLKPIFILFAMAITTTIYSHLDTTMLGLFRSPYEVGIYTAATKVNKIILSVVIAIGSVFMPRLSYYHEKGDSESFKDLSNKSFDLLFLIACPCTIGLSILSVPILHVISGLNYDAAIVPMRIMNPIIIIIGLSTYIGVHMFLPMKKEKLTLIAILTGSIINFILNALLIPNYGAIGAAIATLMAESTIMIIELIFGRNYITIKKLFKTFIKYFTNSIVMGALVYLVTLFISSEPIQLIAGIFTGILMYLILLFIEKNPLLFDLINSVKKRILKK